MGPPPFGDGNTAQGYERPSPHGPFNGATAFRRWKRQYFLTTNRYLYIPSMGPPPFGDGNGPPARSPRCSRLPFNGATAFRRWKPGPARRGRRPSRPFNGATAFRRWKPAAGGVVAGGRRLPSMGPPPFGDGNRYWLLNSAFSPWKFVIVAALVFTARNRSAPVQLKPSRS